LNDPWFRGYETEPRWLRLSRSGAGIRCVEAGFQLDPPTDEAAAHRFWDVCWAYGSTESGVLSVRQVEVDG
jgi:hypothetical protein